MGQADNPLTKLLKEGENSKKQKENRQENLKAEFALSAKEQIHKHMEKSVEPHLDVQLAKKVQTQTTIVNLLDDEEKHHEKGTSK